MKFRPLHDRVVIERIDAEAKTAIIPDTAQEKPQRSKVIAVGPGGRDESGKLMAGAGTRRAFDCNGARGSAGYHPTDRPL